MASYFNMKGTTQSNFMIGIQGPILTKYVDTSGASPVTYLLLPNNVIGSKIILDQSDYSNYIDKTNYTGTAAQAVKLSSKNIGLSITGLSITLEKSDGTTGLSDGSDDIYGRVTAIDASKLALFQSSNNAGIPYNVISGLVVSGDLSQNSDNDKIAASSHTHDQYLSTASFTLSTKDGDTELGQIKINSATESYQVASHTALLSLDIRDSSIVAANLATGAVTEAKIDTGAVTLSKIADNTIQPAKLKPIDSNNGYDADYTARIGKVQAAHDLLDDGKIAGVNISSFLVKNSQTNIYTNKVKNAETADFALSLKDSSEGTTKSAADVITAVNTVSNASTTQSAGNLVLWSESGINGNATSASTAAKLTNYGTFWGHKFDGTNNAETGTSTSIGTESAAASIQYTGNITPHTTDTSDIGTTKLKYKNLYLSNTASALNATITNKVTARLIEINKDTNVENETGIDMNNTTLREVSSITVKSILPYGNTSSDGIIGSTSAPFKKIYVDSPSHYYWLDNGDEVSLATALAGKAPLTHSHSINSLTDTQQYRTETDSNGHETQVPLQFINHIAMEGHHHSMSEIDGIDGIYQFKGTIASVTTENNELVVTGVSTPSHNGDVYNVLASFDYQDKTYPAGTNIVYEIELTDDDPPQEVGHWKPLGGVFNIDLDNFVTSVSQGHFRSNGQVDADYNVWESEIATKSAGSVTTSLWYRARSNDRHTTFETHFPRATATSFGLAKLGYTVSESDRNYPVTIDNNGNLYTHVAWTDNNDIDTYGIAVTTDDIVNNQYVSGSANTNNAAVFENSANTEDDIYINLVHNHRDSSGANSPVVEKSIKVEASGQAKAKYVADRNTPNVGTLSVDVPERAGYNIPIIKCILTPDGDATSMYYDASTVAGTDNGIISDNGVIKNNSLVLLYIEHIQELYDTFHKDRLTCVIRIPAKYFRLEKSVIDKIKNMNGNDPVAFILTHNTNTLDFPRNTAMSNLDLSQKLFLCHICFNRNYDLYQNGSGGTINILDNVGASIENLETPMIRLSNGADSIILDHYNNNSLDNLLARYYGVAQIKLRAYKLNHSNVYTPLPALDLDLASTCNRVTGRADYYDYYGYRTSESNMYMHRSTTICDKETLINNIVRTPTLNKSLNKVRFRGDQMTCPRHPGIIKTHGNVTLKTFDKAKSIKKYKRDYTKIKFKYIISFNNTFEFCSKFSPDEILITKRLSQCYMNTYDKFLLSLNKENTYHY